MAAERLGIHHTQLQTNADNVGQGYRKNAVRQWLREQSGELQSGVMWSGDGGSVALGHVYLTRPIIAALEAGRANAAVSIFNPGVPARVLASEKRASIGALMLSGAREELAAIDSADAGRAFHLFLMFNDQRRHLAAHFEDIDLDRIEFQLPFFDADFLATIVRLPSEPFLEHRFYMDWLALFPNGLTEVPWQAYPGHVPCLLPRPTLKYQWEGYYDKAMFRAMTRKTAQKGERVVRAKNFPSHLISRFNLRAATLLTRTGLRDYGYMINTADVYYRYWNICTTEAAAVN
jgi:asparagine synthase (glutamine-hydrolysing)